MFFAVLIIIPFCFFLLALLGGIFKVLYWEIKIVFYILTVFIVLGQVLYKKARTL